MEGTGKTVTNNPPYAPQHATTYSCSKKKRATSLLEDLGRVSPEKKVVID